MLKANDSRQNRWNKLHRSKMNQIHHKEYSHQKDMKTMLRYAYKKEMYFEKHTPLVILRKSKISSLVKCIYIEVYISNIKNHKPCLITNSQFAKNAGVSLETIKSKIQELKDDKLIQIRIKHNQRLLTLKDDIYDDYNECLFDRKEYINKYHIKL